MRILIGPWPHVHVLIMIKLAVVVEQIVRPGLENNIEGFLEARSTLSQGNAEREIFPRDAAHKTGDNTSARQVVEHRELFGDAQWMAVQRQQIACHGKLQPFRLRRDVSQENIRRIVETVGTAVMLVKTDAVESRLFHQLELFDMV